jgi:cation/acetate symporter
MILGPNVWVDVLGNQTPIFPLQFPTIVAMPLTFITCIVVSLLDHSRQSVADRLAFDRQLILAELPKQRMS